MAKYDELAARLRARLKELTERTEAIETQLRAPLDPNAKERATQLEDDDPLEGIDDVLLAEKQQVEAALARIDNGTYGDCVECDEEIPLKRLEALPTATKCIACASG